MYAEITAAIQSTKALAELLKAAHTLSNHSDLLTAVHAVQMQLTEAIASALDSQEKQAALAEKVRELESRITEAENWQNDVKRYVLSELPSGNLVYALRRENEQGEPMHYLCVSCMDKKHRSTLQPSANNASLYCLVCKTHLPKEKSPSPRPRSGGGTWMSS